MHKGQMQGKVQTVLGPVEPEVLGITMTHEHLLVDLSVWFKEPSAASEKALAYEPVSLENLGWVRYHPVNNLDNNRLWDEEVAASEVMNYKLAGGNSIVEVTNLGIGRDPSGLSRVSRRTGVNIVMGCGYYVEAVRPNAPKLTEKKMLENMVNDITVGADGTDIRAGIIGELGMSWPLSDSDKMLLRAAASAQRETGAPISVHPGRSPDSPFECICELTNAGADISRVIMCHVESTIFDRDTRFRLAETDCYLGYDDFGWESYSWARMVLSESNPVKCDIPNDAERINQITALIDAGFVNKVLVSHDHCRKFRLKRYGGSGHTHILQNVVPLMREKGMSDEHIRTILVDNPKRVLTFV